MKTLKRIVSVLLLAATLISSLYSCGADVDEKEVLAAARPLIEKSDILEDILFGEGISYSLSGVGISYKEADENHVDYYEERLGEKFNTVSDLKSIMNKVYTVGFISDICSGVLSEDLYTGTRYYQNGEKIMVLLNYKKLKVDEIVYDFDTLALEESRGEKTVVVRIDVEIIRSEEKSQKRTLNITMKKESDKWKLDSPTYAVYSDKYQDYKDLEEELNKK